jgi:SSS family solute:Na+ symporter
VAPLPAQLALAAVPNGHLRPLGIYFAIGIWIGFYLKSMSNTGEDFFTAGREMKPDVKAM